MCVKDFNTKLVGVCCDGASINLSEHRGLAALLRADSLWLVAMHCLIHCIELAIKDAFIRVGDNIQTEIQVDIPDRFWYLLLV